MAVTGSFVGLTAGFSLLPLVFVLTLDHILIVLALAYILVRFSLPSYVPLVWADWFVVKQVVSIVLPGLVITRLCTLWVATLAERRRAVSTTTTNQRRGTTAAARLP